MRVLLQDSEEINVIGRLKYYYETYGIYMSHNRKDRETIEFQSMPLGYREEVLFVIGHNKWVKSILDKSITKLKEQKIILITCQTKYHFENYGTPDKTIYIAKQKGGYAPLYCGLDYRFEFDPTESEILSYRFRKKYTFEENIDKAFTKLVG